MRKITILAATLILVGSLTGTALAVLPTLQLGIEGGVYFDGTTYNTTDPFTLQALYNGDGNLYGDTFYLSIAVVPKIDTAVDLGSFTITYSGATTTVDVTADMVFGTPPIATINDGPPGDLAPHGVFPTYFMEFAFLFDETQTVPAINVATGETPPGTLAFRNFIINYAGLDGDFALHFDLYNLDGDNEIDQFAPFSHDAQTNGVPEPGSLFLLGSGLVGLALYGRKSFKR